MAKREITVEFEFVSIHAYGDSYTICIIIKADDERAALNVAHIVGFEYWGARFNDNCIDWRIKK